MIIAVTVLLVASIIALGVGMNNRAGWIACVFAVAALLFAAAQWRGLP